MATARAAPTWWETELRRFLTAGVLHRDSETLRAIGAGLAHVDVTRRELRQFAGARISVEWSTPPGVEVEA